MGVIIATGRIEWGRVMATQMSGRLSKSEREALFLEADRQWEGGKLRSTFQLLLRCAKAGESGAQLNLGYMYDTGAGIKRNRERAMYWYRRAYRNGYASAANNIGTIFRDEGQPKAALAWFERAIRMGDDDPNLEIAKLCLGPLGEGRKAILHLRRAIAGVNVCEASRDEARKLLKKALAVQSR